VPESDKKSIPEEARKEPLSFEEHKDLAAPNSLQKDQSKKCKKEKSNTDEDENKSKLSKNKYYGFDVNDLVLSNKSKSSRCSEEIIINCDDELSNVVSQDSYDNLKHEQEKSKRSENKEITKRIQNLKNEDLSLSNTSQINKLDSKSKSGTTNTDKTAYFADDVRSLPDKEAKYFSREEADSEYDAINSDADGKKTEYSPASSQEIITNHTKNHSDEELVYIGEE
jgi:hypothetical protein